MTDYSKIIKKNSFMDHSFGSRSSTDISPDLDD